MSCTSLAMFTSAVCASALAFARCQRHVKNAPPPPPMNRLAMVINVSTDISIIHYNILYTYHELLHSGLPARVWTQFSPPGYGRGESFRITIIVMKLYCHPSRAGAQSHDCNISRSFMASCASVATARHTPAQQPPAQPSPCGQATSVRPSTRFAVCVAVLPR